MQEAELGRDGLEDQQYFRIGCDLPFPPVPGADPRNHIDASGEFFGEDPLGKALRLFARRGDENDMEGAG